MAKQVQVRHTKKNTLNELNGKEWIKFTKSWFVINPAPRRTKIAHPASFPEMLASKFIEFFTKEEQWIFDPFVGSGSTLIAAKNLNRNSVGVELYPHFVSLAKERLNSLESSRDTKSIVFEHDSRFIKELFKEKELPPMNFCFTSPPYWNQLIRHSERQEVRCNNGLKTSYGNHENDLGLIDNYSAFLDQMEAVFNEVYEVMAKKSYLIVITNNLYSQGRLWPLAFDMVNRLSKKWVPKDERIWCQDNKKLFPFGMFHSYVGNRAHHYCLVFKKE